MESIIACGSGKKRSSKRPVLVQALPFWRVVLVVGCASHGLSMNSVVIGRPRCFICARSSSTCAWLALTSRHFVRPNCDGGGRLGIPTVS